MAKHPKKVKRPYKYNLTKGVRVAISPELDSALRHIRRQFGVSKSHVIRMGIMVALAKQVPEAVAIARDPTVHPSKRLAMLRLLRVCTEANISLKNPEMAAVLRGSSAESVGEWMIAGALPQTPGFF
jgi:hypothetical protein